MGELSETVYQTLLIFFLVEKLAEWEIFMIYECRAIRKMLKTVEFNRLHTVKPFYLDFELNSYWT